MMKHACGSYFVLVRQTDSERCTPGEPWVGYSYPLRFEAGEREMRPVSGESRGNRITLRQKLELVPLESGEPALELCNSI